LTIKRVALMIGGALLTLALLFPPYNFDTPEMLWSKKMSTYDFLFSDHQSFVVDGRVRAATNVEIDFVKLVMEMGIISLVTTLVAFIPRKR
jgi:hypothetical protein